MLQKPKFPPSTVYNKRLTFGLINLCTSSTSKIPDVGDYIFQVLRNVAYSVVAWSSAYIQCTLVDPYTGKDVTETQNVPGELWVKGPMVFKGYTNNPTLTKESFSEDGWLKTGDIHYRDNNWNFHFVDRIKMLLKYKNHQISPVEIEEVIRQHTGVLEVAVTGIPHPDDGELPFACIIKQDGSDVTSKEIEDLVAQSLTDSKRLRGGVIFLNELPLTASSKISRAKLKEVVSDHFEKLQKLL